jgi:predicted nucleic acid-binding protein
MGPDVYNNPWRNLRRCKEILSMKRVTLSVIMVGLLLVDAAGAQQGGGRAGLRWGLDLAPAREQAMKSKQPLMLWIQGNTSERDDMDKVERDQMKAFSDPRVNDLSRKFVLCKVSVSRYRSELVKLLGTTPAHLDLYFVTAEGEKLGEISAAAAKNVDSLAQKMELVFDDYSSKLFIKEIKPILEDEKAKPKDQLAALDLVDKYNIRSADRAIVALVKRGGLDNAVTKKSYETLAAISSKEGVTELFERAINDKRAAEALEKCSTSGLDALLPFLDDQDPAKFLLAYRTVAKICKTTAKPDKFWEGKNEKVKTDEVKRVKDLATKAQARSKERHAQNP